jgi:tape measure domain-containing protein
VAQDAQLLLKVGLDLSTFRNQLATLGQAAAGYNLPIKIKFDRIAVQNELNALGVNIKRRTYKLELATNIKAETENAKVLAKALAELGKAGQQIRGVAGRAATGAEASTVDAAKFQAMVNRATKPALEALYQGMAKAKIPMGEVGSRTVDELKKSIISGIPGLTQDIASGMTKGLEGLKESGRKGAKFVIDSFKDAAGIASPSKVFKQLGQFSAEGLENGFLEGLRDFKGKAVSEIRKIVALMRMELATLGGAASSAVAVAGGGVRGAGRGGTQYMSPIGPLPHGSREPWAYNQGAYRHEPYMAQPGQFRGAGIQSMVSRYPFAPMPGVRATTELPSMFGMARPALPAAGMSSAAGMRQAELFAREAAARARSAERNAAVMRESVIASRVSGQVPLGRGGFPQLPSGTGGALALRGVGGGGGGGTGGGGGGRRLGGGGDPFGGLGRLSLPGAGTIRELGSEFAFATKQVLLFGQAYKLLAFVQDFPGQVGQAVGQLQSFRNTLNAISPSAAEAAKSNEFILSIVDKYNVPIQSARDGFTKLYASMEPAGFRGEEIRGLFESIAMGAATFGMSADKVDRVIYAFSQMASKGQVMSEELKGQLGDVLPGSMALFAEAAGFKGPDAISKFSKALEDGVYKGQNMVKLLKNVRVVMEQEFGPGAEGAARTFQGGINRMQNSLRQLYEAFEPVAVNFMNQVVKPLTDGLRIAADGFTAFLQGVAAKTPQGAAFAQELERLRPALEGIGNNLKGLLPTFESFGNVLLNVGKLLLAIAGNPITGFLLKLYANVLLINTVFSLLGGKILINLITSVGAVISRFIAMNFAMASLQRTSAVANSTLAGTQLQMALLTRNAGAAIGPVTALKTALLGLARIGLIAIAIQVVIDGLSELDRLKKSLDDIAGFSSKEYKKQVQGMSREMVNSAIIVNRRTQKSIRDELKQFQGPIGAARGLITGRDEELRAKLLMVQTKEAVLATGRKNRTQAEIDKAALQSGLAAIPEMTNGDGKKTGAGNKAAKAAERAAKEAQTLEAVLKQLREEIRIRSRILQIDQNIAMARADQDEEAVASYESDKRLLEIGTRKAKIQKDFDAGRIKQAEYNLRMQLLEIDRSEEQLQHENDINRLLRERYGILDAVVKAAREARQRAFEAGGVGADTFRTDINLMPELTGGELGAGYAAAKDQLAELMKASNQIIGAAQAIGDAFATSFKGVISGSMSAQQALAGFFQSVASYFLDMAAKMIAKWIEMQIIGLAMSLLPGAGAIFPKGVGNFSGAFGAGGPKFSPAVFGAANGAVWEGGFQAFANGGIVNGPTMGLIGEGRYNEAIVPLPDGRSIPVEMMGGGNGDISITINVDAKGTKTEGDEGQAKALASIVSAAVQSEIVKQQRPGGLLVR